MAVNLSVHDKAILNCIFNPSLPITEAYQPEEIEDLEDIENNTTELVLVKEKEAEAIKVAENGNNELALEILNECLNLMPEKPSLYNNRAQIYQLMAKFDEAADDLNHCIDLSKNSNGLYKKTLCAALCQRGLIHRKYHRVDMAREDFEEASKLGSKFAKTQLIEINPYAALCNQMLLKVMQEYK